MELTITLKKVEKNSWKRNTSVKNKTKSPAGCPRIVFCLLTVLTADVVAIADIENLRSYFFAESAVLSGAALSTVASISVSIFTSSPRR